MGDPDAAAELPCTLDELEAPPMAAEESERGWWLGPRVGYIEAKDADNGTWVLGSQVRWHILSFLAVEGSIEVHQDRYDDGDIKVFTVPIQISGLVYLPLPGNFRPYAVAGIGWYVTRTHFSGGNTSDDESTHPFGFHLGIGAELELTPRLSINGDFRYIFMDEPPHVGNDEFDAWEVTIGLHFKLSKWSLLQHRTGGSRIIRRTGPGPTCSAPGTSRGRGSPPASA